MSSALEMLSQSVIAGFGLVTSLALIGYVIRWLLSFLSK